MHFIDRVTIHVKSGDGGDGLVAFRREKYVPAGGPAGGNGGNGGSVILQATTDLQTLLDFRFENIFKAEDGERGGPSNMTGRKGSDRVIKVPVGTVVMNEETGEVLGDLTEVDQTLFVAKGGKDGSAFGCMGESKATVIVAEAPKPAAAASGAAPTVVRAAPTCPDGFALNSKSVDGKTGAYTCTGSSDAKKPEKGAECPAGTTYFYLKNAKGVSLGCKKAPPAKKV